MSSSRETLRLHDIVENIDRIWRYTDGLDFPAFVGDPKTVDAVERCLQRITEAVIDRRTSLPALRTDCLAVLGS